MQNETVNNQSQDSQGSPYLIGEVQTEYKQYDQCRHDMVDRVSKREVKFGQNSEPRESINERDSEFPIDSEDDDGGRDVL